MLIHFLKSLFYWTNSSLCFTLFFTFIITSR